MTKKIKLDIIAADKASKQMKVIGKQAETMGGQIKKAGIAMAAFGAAAAGVAVKSMKDWAAAGDEIAKMAKRTGFAAESLSELKYAADLSGTSLDAIEKATK